MKPDEIKYKQELMRTLTASDLVVYGMAYMLPTAPFAMFGILAAPTHGLVPLTYFLSFFAMIFTARSYMIFCMELPVAGSVYSYTRVGINDIAGFFAGWLVFLDYILAPGLLAVVSAVAMNDLIPLIPRWGWILVFIATGTIMNLVGINLTAKANRLMLYVLLAVLAIFLGVGLVALYSGKGNGGLTLASFYTPEAFTWSGIATGVLVGSTNFLGFDAITTLSEEVREDQKKWVGFAGLFTISAIAVMFITQSWVAADLAPGATIQSPETAFYDIARYAGGNSLSVLAAVTTALGFGICCTIVCQSAVTRIIYAMARDRQLPSVFARVHAKTKQPYVANIFVAAMSLIVALFFQNRLEDLFLFQNFGALSAFVLVNISVISYFWVQKRSHKLFRYLVFPALGALISACLVTAMRGSTLVMGACWLTIGILYYATMRYVLHRRVALEV